MHKGSTRAWGSRRGLALVGLAVAVAVPAAPALAEGIAKAHSASTSAGAVVAAEVGATTAADGTGLVGAVSAPVLPVSVLGGTNVVSSLQETRLGRVGGSSTRLAGPDRYATAVAVSQAMAPNPVAEVVLASGAAFPDALSGAPLAAHLGGPLLITSPTSLPAVVAQELARLQPGRITVLGGTGAVSSEVAAAAQSAAGGATLRRIQGADRYETSQRVTALFPAGSGGVLLTTGATFPDGVSAGPVAAALTGPVLLTSPTSLSAAGSAALSRLAPKRLVIAGDTSAVSAAVETSAEAATGLTAQRAAGADRFATSAALAKVLASVWKPGGAFVATGLAFPDALVGGAAAAQQHAPVLLTSSRRGGASATAAVVGRLRGLPSWLQLTLDLLARQQALGDATYVAYDAAYQADSLAQLYGWADPEVRAQLTRMRSVRKPDGGYGLEKSWDAFQDGTVNPSSTSYLATVTDHVGRVLLAGLPSGATSASEVGSLVDLVLAWPRVKGDSSCLAYSPAYGDDRICVYNVNTAAAWFLRAANDAGVVRAGALDLSSRLYSHDAVHESSGWWPYSAASTKRQDWNHNSAMIDAQLPLDPSAGQASLDAVMPNGWVNPDPLAQRYDDAMGYLRLVPYACGYRSSSLMSAARSVAAKQAIGSDTGQLTLWTALTTQACGG